MSLSNRKISNTKLDLSGTIYGNSPVQAEGTINGHSFYFRARHNEWTFSISESSEIDPVDIQTVEAGKKYGFFKEAAYGQNEAESASYMDFKEAEKIILNNCTEYKHLLTMAKIHCLRIS